MLVQMPKVSPMFAAYEAQKQLFDAAIDIAVDEAAQRAGSNVVAEMFKLKAPIQSRLAA